MELLKFKDDTLVAFKNYRALYKKQSGCQLKIFYTDGGAEYIKEFDDYLKENDIAYKVIASYLLKQNQKTERVNQIIIGLIRVILTQQKLFKSL